MSPKGSLKTSHSRQVLSKVEHHSRTHGKHNTPQALQNKPWDTGTVVRHLIVVTNCGERRPPAYLLKNGRYIQVCTSSERGVKDAPSFLLSKGRSESCLVLPLIGCWIQRSEPTCIKVCWPKAKP